VKTFNLIIEGFFLCNIFIYIPIFAVY